MLIKKKKFTGLLAEALLEEVPPAWVVGMVHQSLTNIHDAILQGTGFYMTFLSSPCHCFTHPVNTHQNAALYNMEFISEKK
jgi:hypothetical protein